MKMRNYDCLVAAGGFGTRLGRSTPKSIIEFEGVTLLRKLLSQLKAAGFERILVANNNSDWSYKVKSEVDSMPDVSFFEDEGYDSTFSLCQALTPDMDDHFLFTYGHTPRSTEVFRRFRSNLGMQTVSGFVPVSSKRKKIPCRSGFFEPPFLLHKCDVQSSKALDWVDFFGELSTFPREIELCGPNEFNCQKELENFLAFLKVRRECGFGHG